MRVRCSHRSLIWLIVVLISIKTCLDLVLMLNVIPERQDTLFVKHTPTWLKKLWIRMAYLHVGKTGGVTIRQVLRAGCFRKACREERSRFQQRYKESMVSKLTRGYYHVTKPETSSTWFSYNAYLVSVRNPIHRMASWFMYQHPLNKKFLKSRRSAGAMIHITRCFVELDEYCRLGLGDVAVNAAACQEAQEVSRNCALGRDEACGHMYYNYEYYTGELLRKNGVSQPLWFVIRTEHMFGDWTTINSMLGHDAVLQQDYFEQVYNHRDNYSKDQLPVWNRTISPEGMKNACRYLCKEIQIYKTLIESAVNLNKEEKRESLQDLYRDCPEEALLDKPCPKIE